MCMHNLQEKTDTLLIYKNLLYNTSMSNKYQFIPYGKKLSVDFFFNFEFFH